MYFRHCFQNSFGHLVLHQDIKTIHLIIDTLWTYEFVTGLHVSILLGDDGVDATRSKVIRHNLGFILKYYLRKIKIT